MKKILLLTSFFALICFTSCGDENNPSDPNLLIPVTPSNPAQVKYVKADVNGSSFVFDNATVEKQHLVDTEGNPYTDLIVTASNANDPAAAVSFRLEYMVTGTETCYYFLYQSGDDEYDIETDNSFHFDITHSSANTIKGNFSGTLTTFDGNVATFSNGTFDISF